MMDDSTFPTFRHEIRTNDLQHAKEVMHVLVNATCPFTYDGRGFGGTIRVDEEGLAALKRAGRA